MKKQIKFIGMILAFVTLFLVSCNSGGPQTPDETDAGSLPPVDTDDSGNGGSEVMGSIQYAPDNYNMWDNWYVEIDGVVHLIHLKGLKDGVGYDQDAEAQRGFGHAISTDLVHWEEQDDILNVADSDNPYDVDFRYTGSAIYHDGKCYVYYTMRRWNGQRIGVAVSEDMENWTEYVGNPVLVPDGRYFITFESPDSGNSTSEDWPTIDCRDFLVIPDPETDGFLGYFVASAEGAFTSPTAVVGLAYSKDLLNWEQLGIVYRPNGVSMPEMIDVFEINGTWYMTLTTAKNNGGLNMFSDPYISRAQIYASASTPRGPFVENREDNVLFGGQYLSGYSARTILFRDQLRMMYTDSNGGSSVLSLPKTVGLNEDGYLRLFYASDLLDVLRTGSLTTNILVQPSTSFAWNTHGGVWTKSGNSMSITTDPYSWQAAIFDSISMNMEMCFTMEASSTASSFGIALTNSAAPSVLNDINHLLVLDRENDRVYLTDSTWELRNCRYFDFDENTEYEVRMLLLGNTIELYINGEFVFNSSITNTGRNHAGIFANDGSMSVKDLELYKLES